MSQEKSTRVIYSGMTELIQPVILCGGSGTRLWPLSRSGFPKQFLCLTGDESLFQQAARRLVALGSVELEVTKPIIVTGEEHRFLANEQLREVGIELGAALLEPVGRNTAPALTLTAFVAQASGQDPVMVVTPADQTVANTVAFTQALQAAVREAASGVVVIMGITPDKPKPATATFKRMWKPNNPPCWFSALLKSPTRPLQNSSWPKVATTGTPACSSSRRPSGSKL